MSGIDWLWCPDEVVFKEVYAVHEPQFGKVPHEHMSPYWVMDFTLPEYEEDTRRDIERAVSKSGGTIPFNVFDPRVPFPAYHHGAGPPSSVPDLYVKAVSRLGTITVAGEAGDVISHGDPIAFTYEGWRYYFKAQDDLVLSGNDQILPVFVRPRRTLNDINVLADRIKPTARFNVFVNEVIGSTRGPLSKFALKGVEFWGRL